MRDFDKLSWHRSDFHYPRTPAEYRNLAHEVLRSTPFIEGLCVSSCQATQYLGIIPLMQSIDPNYAQKIKGMPVEESTNLGVGNLEIQGALLCLFCPHPFFFLISPFLLFRQ